MPGFGALYQWSRWILRVLCGPIVLCSSRTVWWSCRSTRTLSGPVFRNTGTAWWITWWSVCIIWCTTSWWILSRWIARSWCLLIRWSSRSLWILCRPVIWRSSGWSGRPLRIWIIRYCCRVSWSGWILRRFMRGCLRRPLCCPVIWRRSWRSRWSLRRYCWSWSRMTWVWRTGCFTYSTAVMLSHRFICLLVYFSKSFIEVVVFFRLLAGYWIFGSSADERQLKIEEKKKMKKNEFSRDDLIIREKFLICCTYAASVWLASRPLTNTGLNLFWLLQKTLFVRFFYAKNNL